MFRHSELVFEKGVEVATKYTSKIDDSCKILSMVYMIILAMYMIEEFFYAALDIK